MKNLARLSSLATLITVFAASANPLAAPEGFSVQASLGNYTHKLSFAGISIDESDVGFGLRASYRFTPYITADIGYFDFGEYSETYIDGWGDRVTDKVGTSALKVGVTGSYPLNNNVQIFGRVGVAFWDTKLSVIEHDIPELSYSVSDDGNDFYVGVGAEYAFNRNLAVALEYSYLDTDISVGNDTLGNQITGLVASFKYSF